jgi:hypothetical protein
MTSEVESSNMDKRLALVDNRLPKSLGKVNCRKFNLLYFGTATSEVLSLKT